WRCHHRDRIQSIAIMTPPRSSHFSPAGSPVPGNAIRTDSSGLVAGEVQIPAPGGTMPGYRAAPKLRRPYPIVLVVQEVLGAHQPKVRPAVAWYGRLSGPKNSLQPRRPLDVAGQLNAPVLGLYGGQDASIPRDQVEQMRAALREAKSASQVLVYPDAPHAFYA